MNAIEFACFFEKLMNSVGTRLDSDIVAKIYDYYDSHDYTLLELINELYISRVQIDCPWNKKELLKLIEERHVEIPKKSKAISNDRILDITSDHVYIYDCNFEFSRGDVIRLENGKTYSIYIEKILVHLMNLYDHEEICMNVTDFLRMIDHDDITILQNIDKCHLMKD